MIMKESRKLNKLELKELEEFKNLNIVQSGIIAGMSAFGCLLYATNSEAYDKTPSFIVVVGWMAIILFIGVVVFFFLYYLTKSLAPFRVKYLKMIDVDNKEDE